MRCSTQRRTTAETDITLALALDGEGNSSVDSGSGFLDHMLTLFARHGHFDLTLTCRGDRHVDYHHTAEDIGITLGLAFADSLGDCRGIRRYADITLPMDETLILCAVDISGRAYLNFDAEMPTERVGTFDTELCREFMQAFARSAGITLHIKKLYGDNSHHIIEAIFKALARAMCAASSIDEAHRDKIPSTKEIL